jgi:CheY-like chemotaxis protein
MKPLHVLVVEDEFMLREDIAAYLRDCGCAVYEAATAELGLRLHVLFTDINLNGAAEGWEVAEVFRAACPTIGVLYTSGNPLDRSRRVSGSGFLRKPYDKVEVLKAGRDMRGSISSGGLHG